MPTVANLICDFTECPRGDFSAHYDIEEWYDGKEATVNAHTNEVESCRYYYYQIPRDILNTVVQKLKANGVRFKIVWKDNFYNHYISFI